MCQKYFYAIWFCKFIFNIKIHKNEIMHKSGIWQIHHSVRILYQKVYLTFPPQVRYSMQPSRTRHPSTSLAPWSDCRASCCISYHVSERARRGGKVLMNMTRRWAKLAAPPVLMIESLLCKRWLHGVGFVICWWYYNCNAPFKAMPRQSETRWLLTQKWTPNPDFVVYAFTHTGISQKAKKLQRIVRHSSVPTL